MLLLGFLANTLINPAVAITWQRDGQLVSLAGGVGQFINQFKGVVFTMVFAGTATFVILKVVNALVGLRVSEEDENLGLDLAQHGESAYND
jgi:ammonia channel protein AmtB